jgi:hypothetical protein
MSLPDSNPSKRQPGAAHEDVRWPAPETRLDIGLRKLRDYGGGAVLSDAEADAILADRAALVAARDTAERERDELREALQDELDNWNPEARPTISAELRAAEASRDVAAAAFRDLLAIAEEEVGPKDSAPEKDAAYWAAIDLDKGYQVPGVQRRIRLARAVLAAREALRVTGQPLSEPGGVPAGDRDAEMSQSAPSGSLSEHEAWCAMYTGTGAICNCAPRAVTDQGQATETSETVVIDDGFGI